MNKIILTSLFALLGMGAFAQRSNRHDKKERKLELKEVRCPRRKGQF
jgi:hypothetical protein